MPPRPPRKLRLYPCRSPRSPQDTRPRGVWVNVGVVIAVAVVTGICFSILLLTWNDIALSIYRVTVFTVIYAWPAVIGTWIVTGGARRWLLASIGIYVLLLMAAGWFAGSGPFLPFELWVWSLIPTLAVVAFLTRPLRGVGPLVLGTVMAAIAGAQAIYLLITASGPIIDWGDANLLLFGVAAGFVGSLVLAVLVGRLLAAWYRGSGFSDQMLLLGSVFFVFAIDSSAGIRPTDGWAFAAGMAVFIAMGALALVLYRVVHRKPSAPAALLVLRVFSPRRGAQRLLDRISAQWRYLGPVRMIGGPDLAVASVEPDEFLTFLSGDLPRLFVDSPATLEQRRESLVVRQDPDARYRVEEFFCFDDTWRLAVVELLRMSHSVLMDLRDFGPDNQGCLVEIEMLAGEGALDRAVFLVDATTDDELLEGTLGSLSAGGRPTIIEVPDDERADDAVKACLELAVGEPTATGR